MDYPIVSVETKDKLPLHGMLLEAKNSKTIAIFLHGTASNFYENDFIKLISQRLIKQKISLLSTNNRGSDVLKAYPPMGSATEYFEACLKDIDTWIKFALSKHKKIILIGHSLGTEKIVYYMNKGKYRNKVKAVALLAFSDSYGSQMRYIKNSKKLISEAKRLVRQGEGNQFLTSDWLPHAGTVQKNAKSYINFFDNNSILSRNFPLHNVKTLNNYSKIKVPILAVIGDKDKWRFMNSDKAKKLLEKENKLTEFHSIKNCNHDFEGKEEQLANIVDSFLHRKL